MATLTLTVSKMKLTTTTLIGITYLVTATLASKSKYHVQCDTDPETILEKSPYYYIGNPTTQGCRQMCHCGNSGMKKGLSPDRFWCEPLQDDEHHQIVLDGMCIGKGKCSCQEQK